MTRDDGSVARLDAAGAVAPASPADLAAVAQRIAGEYGIAEQGLIREEDAYYFRRRDSFVLPAYRVILADVDNTRYYLDPTSGALLQRTDANGRWHRWLFGALHRIDFAFLRARPLWDIVTLFLMLGGLAVTATGSYLALRRIGVDVGSLLRRRKENCGTNRSIPVTLRCEPEAASRPGEPRMATPHTRDQFPPHPSRLLRRKGLRTRTSG